MSDDPHDLDSGPDPAAYAASAPEPAPAPGDEIGPPVHAVVVGFETVVDLVRDRTDADLLTCGYRDEAATRTTLGGLAEHAGGDGRDDAPFSDLSVLVVRQ